MPVCTVCLNLIPSGSLYCSVCSHYQGKQKWRNELKFWGGLTGVATLIAASVAVLIGFYQSVSSRFFGYDVYVVDFSTTDNLQLFNPSENSVVVTSFQFRSVSHGIDFLLPLAEVVDPGESLPINIPREIRKSIAGWNRDYLGGAVENYVHVSGLDAFLVKKFGAAHDFSPQDFYGDTPSFFNASGVAVEDFGDNFVPDFLLYDGAEHRHLKSLNDSEESDKILIVDAVSEQPSWFFRNNEETPECEAIITYTTMPFGREGSESMNCALAYHSRLIPIPPAAGPQ